MIKAKNVRLALINNHSLPNFETVVETLGSGQ
jgi:hypothetical protein